MVCLLVRSIRTLPSAERSAEASDGGRCSARRCLRSCPLACVVRPYGVQKRSVLCRDRKSTRLNSSHVAISYAVFCLKKKKKELSKLGETYRVVRLQDTLSSD